MKVVYIPEAGNGFIGRVNIREIQAYNRWLKEHGYVWNGRHWILP